MASFRIKVRDKATREEKFLNLSGPHDVKSAKAHIENMPGSQGGKHPGFEVLDVEQVDLPGAPAQPAVTAVATEGAGQ